MAFPLCCFPGDPHCVAKIRSGGRKHSVTGTGWDLQRGFRAQSPGPTPDSLKGQVEARAHLVLI